MNTPADSRMRSLLIALSSLFLLPCSLFPQGTLTPPGAPAPTMKTLAELEPRTAISITNTPGDNNSLFKITQPGSYYVTGNISGVIGKHGIAIAASGVMLDLNGFDLAGVASSLDGVSVTASGLTNIAVVNGSIRGWSRGVDVRTFGATGCRVDRVLASGNASTGINGGDNCAITNCSVSFNTAHGIDTGSSNTVSNCFASSNSGTGIIAFGGSTVTNCSAYLNVGDGISTATGCSVTNCSASFNMFNGISAGGGNAVSSCSVSSNSRTGIATSNGCTVTNCSASFSSAVATGNGISTGNDCTIANCTVASNTASGIAAGVSSTVTNCSASDNTGSGISANSGSTVADCSARNNTLDGIVCAASCVIRGNTCTSNGFGAGDGAGIHATGSHNRIEGNNCTLADRGIGVDFSGNIIIKNTCSGNTIDWVIASNNVFGPIIDRRTPANAAVSGAAAGSSLGSAEPNANFTF